MFWISRYGHNSHGVGIIPNSLYEHAGSRDYLVDAYGKVITPGVQNKYTMIRLGTPTSANRREDSCADAQRTCCSSVRAVCSLATAYCPPTTIRRRYFDEHHPPHHRRHDRRAGRGITAPRLCTSWLQPWLHSHTLLQRKEQFESWLSYLLCRMKSCFRNWLLYPCLELKCIATKMTEQNFNNEWIMDSAQFECLCVVDELQSGYLIHGKAIGIGRNGSC